MLKKWPYLLALLLGCANQPNSVEYPTVTESWGSASASLGATEDKGYLHVNLKDGLKLIWISVSLYGGPEDSTIIAEADMPEELKEWILANEMVCVPIEMLEFGEPLFDGKHAWRNYGGVSCLVSTCPGNSNADRERVEWLRNAPIGDLRLTFGKFDCSQGYKDIGYIYMDLRCEDGTGVQQDFYVLLNRTDLKRLEIGKSIFEDPEESEL